jgi:hypothetical protein
MVVSNKRASKERIDFKIIKVIAVDSGEVLNNVGGRVKKQDGFINDYKFVLLFFENLLLDTENIRTILKIV